VYMDTKSDTSSQELQGRHVLAPAFDNLNQYDATTHFNGQNTVVWMALKLLASDIARRIKYRYMRVSVASRLLPFAILTVHEDRWCLEFRRKRNSRGLDGDEGDCPTEDHYINM
jgi:hypothetical protein